MADAASLAKELNYTYAIAISLNFATHLAHFEGSCAKVERLASDLIEHSTCQHFVLWPAIGTVFRGWARSVVGDTAEGISWIDNGIRDYRATGAMLNMPFWLALRAEALHLADRCREALESIDEAEALVERSEERWCCSELYQLRAVFLAAMDAEEIDIELAFREAIRIATEQKSISLAKRAETSFAEYRRQKASGSRGGGFRLPLC